MPHSLFPNQPTNQLTHSIHSLNPLAQSTRSTLSLSLSLSVSLCLSVSLSLCLSPSLPLLSLSLSLSLLSAHSRTAVAPVCLRADLRELERASPEWKQNHKPAPGLDLQQPVSACIAARCHFEREASRVVEACSCSLPTQPFPCSLFAPSTSLRKIACVSWTWETTSSQALSKLPSHAKTALLPTSHAHEHSR